MPWPVVPAGLPLYRHVAVAQFHGCVWVVFWSSSCSNRKLARRPARKLCPGASENPEGMCRDRRGYAEAATDSHTISSSSPRGHASRARCTCGHARFASAASSRSGVCQAVRNMVCRLFGRVVVHIRCRLITSSS